MLFSRTYIFSLFQVLIFIFSLLTDWYRILSIALTILTLIWVLDKMGKGIVLRELIALLSCFICLAMPILGYTTYTKDNFQAMLWLKYMPIPENEYFSYALPAIAGYASVLCWPLTKKTSSDAGFYLQQIIFKAREILARHRYLGVYFIVIGLTASLLSNVIPTALRFMITLISWMSFTGVLYLHFTKKFPLKKLILILFALLIAWNSLQSGMFTIIAYMSITLSSFFFLGVRFPFWKKLLFFSMAVVGLIILQSVKANFRKATWKQDYEGSRAALFGSLVAERFSSSSSMFAEEAFFPIYYRTNQGFNVALVMRRFPDVQPYDYGTNIARSFAAAFVPRVLWPEKPEAGGKANMYYYTGIVLKGWSTNVGPLGEAYGSFGPTGGILFMLALGAFIRFAYRQLFVISRNIPLLVFWLPVIFYQITYSAESDILQIFNSLMKSIFLIWILYKWSPQLFGVYKDNITLRQKKWRQISS